MHISSAADACSPVREPGGRRRRVAAAAARGGARGVPARVPLAARGAGGGALCVPARLPAGQHAILLAHAAPAAPARGARVRARAGAPPRRACRAPCCALSAPLVPFLPFLQAGGRGDPVAGCAALDTGPGTPCVWPLLCTGASGSSAGRLCPQFGGAWRGQARSRRSAPRSRHRHAVTRPDTRSCAKLYAWGTRRWQRSASRARGAARSWCARARVGRCRRGCCARARCARAMRWRTTRATRSSSPSLLSRRGAFGGPAVACRMLLTAYSPGTMRDESQLGVDALGSGAQVAPLPASSLQAERFDMCACTSSASPSGYTEWQASRILVQYPG